MNKEEILKQLGRNIKAERVRKGFSQEDFAEILHVHPSYIGKVEQGRQNMSIGKILEFATALNIHINDLLKFN